MHGGFPAVYPRLRLRLRPRFLHDPRRELQKMCNFRRKYSENRAREKVGDEAPQALDENNKIHAFPPEAFRLSYCAPYIDDAKAHAEKILAEFAELKKARDEYRKKIDAFNDLLPSGIIYANEREPKNYLM